MLSESALIVASILLAFGIDAWWDERRDRADEKEMLLGLQSEYRANLEALNSRYEYHRQELVGLERLALATQAGEWTDEPELLDDSLNWLLTPRTLDLGNGVVDALLAGGRIELLTNLRLRDQLASWRGVLGEVMDDESDNSEMVFRDIAPYLSRNGIPVSSAFKASADNVWLLPARTIAGDSERVNALLNDPEFQTLVELRLGYKYHFNEELDAAIDAAKAILAEIEVSLSAH